MTSKRPLRVAGLISGGGRTLLNLLELSRKGELDIEIVTVIASRDCAGLGRCEAENLPTHLVEFKQFGSGNLQAYSDAITALLDDAKVDLVLMAGFLSKYIVPEKYAGRILNIHPALLPKFGGKGCYGNRVHAAVIEAGETESGCTVHYVTNEYDAGPPIVQRTVPVLPDDTTDALAARVFEQECIAYPEAVRIVTEKILSENE